MIKSCLFGLVGGIMFAWLRRPAVLSTAWVTLLLLTVPLLTSCTPNANAKIISPKLGAIEVLEEEMGVVEAKPTAVPLKLADFDAETRMAGLPDPVAAAMASADAGRGEKLHVTEGCNGCHSLDPAVDGTGPTWVNLGNTAAARTTATNEPSPAAYLYTSISNPGAYVVDGYADGVMLSIYLEQLSDQDFADLITFILSQTTN